MKTIKVIDLLNKIANGEKIPEKFKFAGQTFEKQGSYIEDEDGDSIFDSMCTDFSNINEEIEVMEEDKKIEKFTEYEMKRNMIGEWNMALKINEIIDKVNEIETASRVLLAEKVDEITEETKKLLNDTK